MCWVWLVHDGNHHGRRDGEFGFDFLTLRGLWPLVEQSLKDHEQFCSTFWQGGHDWEVVKTTSDLGSHMLIFSSVAQSCLTLCNPMNRSTPGLPVHHRLLELTQTHIHWWWHRWCHPTISSSVVPFFHLQSFLASGSFPMNHFFTSGGQSVGVSASASVLPMNIQVWFPLGWTGLILQAKGFSRVFYNTVVQKHQFFGTQLSL